MKHFVCRLPGRKHRIVKLEEERVKLNTEKRFIECGF